MSEPSSSSALIELCGLSRSFREGERERRVLDGVNETIERGSVVVLLGRSGSGKSTLLNLLAGIDRPTAGEVRIGGRSLSALSERERTLFRRREVGFVFQFFNLIPTLTVRENVSLRLELDGRLDQDGRRRVHDLLQEVGLDDRAESYPDRLSGGEQQRVAIAAAASHRPSLVLADEPTGNLDADTGARVLQLLQRLVRRERSTLLIATHARDAASIADRVLTLQQGKLVPQGVS